MRTLETIWHVEETHWGVEPVRLSLGPAHPTWLRGVWVKSAHAVVFGEEQVLLVREARTMWHFPGGRLEDHEAPEQALARELMEEAGATLAPDPRLFAAVQVEFPERPPGRLQPRGPSMTAFYVAELAGLTAEFAGDPDVPEQSTQRQLVSFTEADTWLSPLNRRLLQEALRG